MEDIAKKREALLSFSVNNVDLAELKSRLAVFNPFKILNIQDYEIRHSTVLAWLIDPQGNHGMGDAIFRSVLLEALMEHKDDRIDSLINEKFDDIEVRREWRNIDITAISRHTNTVVVIENKWNANESEQQLQKYVDIIKNKYPKYNKVFIFLTLDGTMPKGSDLYIPLTHGQVYEQIKSNITLKKDSINPQVYDFIGYYLKILEEKSMPNESFVALCSKLYRDNKEAIETILEYGKPKLPPDSIRYFHDQTKTESIHMNKESINVYYPFIPCNWSGKVPLTNKYTSDRYLVFFT